ncbi:hypothetical protein ACFLYP_02365 [Chloroflexota bacterium]
MNRDLNTNLKPALMMIAGILYVVFMTSFVRPRQNDLAHAVGLLTIDGGQFFHPVEYAIDQDILGDFTLFLTASVIPPVSGDMQVTLVGPEELDYFVSSRYPPGVPITNRADRWYSIGQHGNFYNVTSGSDLVIVIKFKPPSSPGKYALNISDKHTGQVYFSMPVIVHPPGGPASGEDCHEE